MWGLMGMDNCCLSAVYAKQARLTEGNYDMDRLEQKICSKYVQSHRLLVQGNADLLPHRHLAWPKLARLPNGNLVLIYFGGHAHTGRKGIYVRISEDEGETFGPAELLWWGQEPHLRVANGALGVTGDGKIIVLAMAVGGASPNQTSEIRGFVSQDNGVTWRSADTPCLSGTVRSVFGRILEVPERGLLATGFNTTGSKGMNQTALWAAWSEDGGYSWGVPRLVTSGHQPAIEPSLVIQDRHIRGIAHPFPSGGQNIYWEIAAAFEDKKWSATLTPIKVGQQAAPYVFTRGGTLLALITDRASTDEQGNTVGEITLWIKRKDKLGWEKRDKLLEIPRGFDFGYPWGATTSDGSEFIVYYAGRSNGVANLYSFRLLDLG